MAASSRRAVNALRKLAGGVSRETVLAAGELLYIPRHAWHYVRSLETSFSTSFWFGAKMALVRGEGGEFRAAY